ncbi:hypothetical protein HPB50_017592 [Hyalomma asiaticum]|uniref:Uncharacterized protein n=1 Tax=Hyalomma asiaticum TaxID=266040 RepID=A0ACB7TJ57_HYAAI|nr:hypothetical protein HPB50_017592 [Hyalomma asiaticum]
MTYAGSCPRRPAVKLSDDWSDGHNLDSNGRSRCIDSSGSMRSAGGMCRGKRVGLLAFGDSEKSDRAALHWSVPECEPPRQELRQHAQLMGGRGGRSFEHRGH